MAAAVAALVVADCRGSRRGVWLFKPVASSVFVLAALAHGATGSRYGALVLAALALSWLGDVLLVPTESSRCFRGGIAAFAGAHLAYGAAFLVREVDPVRIALAVVPVGVAVFAATRWLRPHVPAEMAGPVTAYMAIISTMVVTAAGASRADPWTLVGALLFYVSDLTVARERFVAPSPWNAGLGLPLYYGAQLVLANTVESSP